MQRTIRANNIAGLRVEHGTAGAFRGLCIQGIRFIRGTRRQVGAPQTAIEIVVSRNGPLKGIPAVALVNHMVFAFWDRADPFSTGAGHAAGTLMTSALSTPRGLRRHRATQRPAVNQASDDQGALGESSAMAVPEYHGQCKKRLWDGRVASDGNRSAAMA